MANDFDFDKYVAGCSAAVRLEMIEQYEELQSRGQLGECALRYHARKFFEDMEPFAPPVVSTMTQLAIACYKNFAQDRMTQVRRDNARRKVDNSILK